MYLPNSDTGILCYLSVHTIKSRHMHRQDKKIIYYTHTQVQCTFFGFIWIIYGVS